MPSDDKVKGKSKAPGNGNLIPASERSPEWRAEQGRKGGIAAGKTKRKTANLRKSMGELLKLDLPPSKVAKTLEAMGIDPTTENGILYSLLLRAIKSGDPQSIKLIMELTGQNRHPTDTREQNARINRMKADTKRIEAEVASFYEDDDDDNTSIQSFLDALMNPEAVEEVFADEAEDEAPEEKA